MQLKYGTKLQGGKYKITRVLGQGGFGITYLAKHTMLDKEVAIKEFFPKGYCDRDREGAKGAVSIPKSNSQIVNGLKSQFLKEAKIIAQFDHPNIVKVQDIFEENGTAYYVMDYIKGDNLMNIVKRNGPLERDYVIRDIRKIGKALRYIHKRKYLHLDVKPNNIILRRSDKEPILIDFGLSKHYDSDNKETTVCLPCFSSGFASKELYMSDGIKSFHPTVDIYSLGATMYYLATGIVPPDAISLINGTKQLELKNHVPDEFHNVISMMMGIGDGKKYETIDEMLADLPKEGFKKTEVKLNIWDRIYRLFTKDK